MGGSYDFGYSCHQHSVDQRRAEIQRCQWSNRFCFSGAWLAPDWTNQWNRVQVPCANCKEYMWCRCVKVTTLGELFMLLGRKYTTAAIYVFHRTLRIVVLKRHESQSFCTRLCQPMDWHGRQRFAGHENETAPG